MDSILTVAMVVIWDMEVPVIVLLMCLFCNVCTTVDYYHGDGYGYNFADHGGGECVCVCVCVCACAPSTAKVL